MLDTSYTIRQTIKSYWVNKQTDDEITEEEMENEFYKLDEMTEQELLKEYKKVFGRRFRVIL